jgi:hypothetical protein
MAGVQGGAKMLTSLLESRQKKEEKRVLKFPSRACLQWTKDLPLGSTSYRFHRLSVVLL